MIEKEPKWELPGSEIEKIVQQLMQERSMPPHYSRMLAMRGIRSTGEIEAFVNPSLDDLRDPDRKSVV